MPVQQKPHHENDRRACAPAEAEADALPRPGETRTRHRMGDFVLVVGSHRLRAVRGLERRDLFAWRGGGRVPQAPCARPLGILRHSCAEILHCNGVHSDRLLSDARRTFELNRGEYVRN